jgi:tetratricopeptide (TPR) repeat protein
MLPLQSPLEAYRADLSRHPNRTDFGRSDTVWLLVAHCLHRLSRAQGEARRSIAENCASAIGDLAGTVSPDTPEEATMIAQLARMRVALPRLDSRDSAGDVVDSARILADQMADAGALWLAFSALGHVRSAAVAAPQRDLGLAMADQAWVSRTLGDLDSADELYDGVGAAGDRHREPELRARALLGKGVTARVRGNYPKARQHLSDGLTCAANAGLDDLAAIGHQGLLIAAATAGDHHTALVHGWAAYELAEGNTDRQAEILINLAQVSLVAGQARAARSGFMASMSRSGHLRVRLPCLGGAAVASATLTDDATLTSLTRAAEESIAAAALPFESASLLRSLYDAYGIAGDAARAEEYRLRARTLARKNGFFEIVLATESADTSKYKTRPATAPLSEDSLSVIHALESLATTEPLAEALALTP